MKNNKLQKNLSLKQWLIKKFLSNETTKEEVLNFIATSDEDASLTKIGDNNKKSLIKNILNLTDKSVEDVMVPRAEIISVNKNQKINEILSIIKNETHSRMPVYDDNLDNILGFFHIKDLINNISDKNFHLESLLRDILYVAPKSPILDLLKRMRSSRIHMGLVVDEFGGVDGLVTIEDLVEEIVGEIEDEHDTDDSELIKIVNINTIIVDASYKIEKLKKHFDIEFNLEEEKEIDTVGGMLFFIANKVPKNNQIYKYMQILQFKVIKATARRIISLEIKKI